MSNYTRIAMADARHRMSRRREGDKVMTKTISVTDFLTAEEIDRAIRLYSETLGKNTFATRCAAEIIEPALPRINEKLGQENDAKYLAYAVEYALAQAGAGG